MSKTQSAKTTFKTQILNFTDICRDILEFLNPIASTKTITINCNSMNQIIFIADLEMLKTILRILGSNAIKFTNKNGVINITAEENFEDITISISDNGTGISPNRLSKLFDTSQVLTTEGAKAEKGTGSGLSLCKEFVERHGGKIWVESIPGKGSVFSFNIPQKPKSKIKGLHKNYEAGARKNNLKILVVDDSQTIRMILGDMVKQYGTEILFAQTGNEAVDIFQDNPDIDLILMDKYMPEMDGYEAARLIRQVNKNVIIIISTADEFSTENEEFAGVVINDFLPKPFSKSYLKQLIIKHFPNDIPE